MNINSKIRKAVEIYGNEKVASSLGLTTRSISDFVNPKSEREPTETTKILFNLLYSDALLSESVALIENKLLRRVHDVVDSYRQEVNSISDLDEQLKELQSIADFKKFLTKYE